MPQSFPKVPHWEFSATDGKPALWRWRRIAVDGAILDTSERLPDFAKAVHDAMGHGFNSTTSHWVIKQSHWLTHFSPDGAPVSISPDNRVIQRAPEAAPPSPMDQKASQ